MIFRSGFTQVLLGACCLVFASVAVQAQSVYRVVGQDGKVTFSDRAPEKSAAGSGASSAKSGSGPTVSGDLPYDLRQIAQRFPVTLYTGDNCAPCAAARNLLVQRGIPFVERTVNSNEDIEALQRVSGTNSLPVGSIGGQQLVGYSPAEWIQYLDAAGYPKESRLPANFRRVAAAPLVAVQAAQAESKPAAEREAAKALVKPSPPASTGPSPSNPAGIKF